MSDKQQSSGDKHPFVMRWEPQSWFWSNDDRTLFCKISRLPATEDRNATEYAWNVDFYDGVFAHSEDGYSGSFEAAVRTVGDLVYRRGWFK